MFSGNLWNGREMVETVNFVPKTARVNRGTKYALWLISCPKYDIILPVTKEILSCSLEEKTF